MKRIITFFFFISVCMTVNAQWRITPEAGVNITTYEHSNTKAGLHLGASVAYDLPSVPFFGIRTGLFLDQRNNSDKGYYYYFPMPGDDGLSLYSLDYKQNRFFLKVPVLADFHWNAGQVRMGVSAGPYVALGIGGKSEYNYNYADEDFHIKESYSSRYDTFDYERRFDWGVSFGFNVEYKRFTFSITEDLGYGKQYKGQYRDGIRPYYHTLTLAVGYRF